MLKTVFFHWKNCTMLLGRYNPVKYLSNRITSGLGGGVHYAHNLVNFNREYERGPLLSF